MDAVAQAPEDADDEQEERPEKETVRFFVVGDIGEPGPWRVAVADAMASLQRSDPGAAFVLTTGDNSYKSAASPTPRSNRSSGRCCRRCGCPGSCASATTT